MHIAKARQTVLDVGGLGVIEMSLQDPTETEFTDLETREASGSAFVHCQGPLASDRQDRKLKMPRDDNASAERSLRLGNAHCATCDRRFRGLISNTLKQMTLLKPKGAPP